MLLGLGLDLASIPRVEAAWQRFGPRFLARCFTPAEAAHCLARPRPAAALALRFAAKEAFAKAAGLGFKGIGPQEIEVVQDERGRPSLALHGRARAWAEAAGVGAAWLSLSDDGDMAAAVVALEARP